MKTKVKINRTWVFDRGRIKIKNSNAITQENKVRS